MIERGLKPSGLGTLAVAGVLTGLVLSAGWLGWQACVALAAGVPSTSKPQPLGMVPPLRADLAELTARGLHFPVEGVSPAKLSDSFRDPRRTHVHHALDIQAPRLSPVRAVDAGLISRLVSSPAGGITIYHLDPSSRYCYYYAHLARYAAGLREGLAVQKGQVLGYVGTTGNAPRRTPHLHFAIFRVNDPKRVWSGIPINPYPVLKTADSSVPKTTD